jgi:hypothetical protein
VRYYDRQGNPLHDVEEFARMFANNRVAETMIGDVRVSTVWLGVDHNFSGKGPPLIFETMVFGGDLDGECYRYPTETDALKGHASWVKAATS